MIYSFDFLGKAAREKLGDEGLYAQSKFGVVVVAKEFARRYGTQVKPAANGEGGEVLSIPVNPGNLKTDLQRHMSNAQKYIVVRSNSFLPISIINLHLT